MRFCSIMVFWFLLVPARVPGIVSLITLVRERGPVPSSFLGSSWLWLGSGACLSIYFSLSFCPFLFHHDFLVPFGFRLGFLCLNSFFFVLPFFRKGAVNEFLLTVHMTFVEAWIVAVWGLCWCNLISVLYILLRYCTLHYMQYIRH